MKTFALFHPGEMGAAVAACLVARGIRVVWASENRSPASVELANEAGLENLQTLDRTLAEADAVLS